jgi:hypothetical protein
MKTCEAIFGFHFLLAKQRYAVMIKLQLNKHPRSLQVVLETLGFHCVISGLVYQGRMWLCIWKSNVGFYTFGGSFLDFVELDERVCEECCLNFSEDF